MQHSSGKTKTKHLGESPQQMPYSSLHYPQAQHPHFAHQTISRSNNIHRQFYGHPRSLANLNYYDQPNMSLTMRPSKERTALLSSHFGGPQGPIMMLPPAASVSHYPSNTFGNTRHSKQLMQQQIYQEPQQAQQHHQTNLIGLIEQQARLNKPLCRCRVMYLGSSVPHVTKNGLHGIQEPLRHLYPEEQFSPSRLGGGMMASRLAGSQQQQQFATTNGQQMVLENTIDISHLSSSLGIDSWLSVWSNGLLLENFDEFGREMKRFFSIESLHYCAAIRFFDTSTLVNQQQHHQHQHPANGQEDTTSELRMNPNQTFAGPTSNVDDPKVSTKSTTAQNGAPMQHQATPKKGVARFLPLDAPIFQCPGMMDANHPPVFASIMRRTSGIKVLECHAFICRRDAAANALVRCCTHAYADFLSAKRLSADLGGLQFPASASGAYYYPYATNESGLLQQQQQHRHSRQANHDSMSLGKPRSQSVGRPSNNANKRYSSSSNNHKIMAGPQYQVVEAIVNQRSSLSSKNRGASSSGGISQETDNSLEVSSEDNYAIIPKHSSLDRAHLAAMSHDANNNNSGASYARSRSKERRRSRTSAATRAQSQAQDRRIKGSSKSLFKDFQPPPPPPPVPQVLAHETLVGGRDRHRRNRRHMGEPEKRLSQSLEYISALANSSFAYPLDDDLIPVQASVGGQKNPTDDTVQYSIVRNKRHSKSMQNLEGPFEFSASMIPAKSSSRDSGRRRYDNGGQSKYYNQKNGAPANNEMAHKAASYQDMSRRRDSMSSDQMTIHSCGSHLAPQLSTSKNMNELNNNCRIYDTCADSIDRIDQLDHAEHSTRVLTSEGYITPSRSSKSMLANEASKSATMKTGRSKSRTKQSPYYHENNNNNLPEQQLNHRSSSNVGQNYMSSFNARCPVIPQPPPPLHPTPASSYYQPTSLAYQTLSSPYHPSQANLSDHQMQLYAHNHPHQPVYMHPYYMSPQPAMPYHHPHQQPQPLYPTTPIPPPMTTNGPSIYESSGDGAHYMGPLRLYHQAQSQTLGRSTLGRHLSATNDISMIASVPTNGRKKTSAKTSLANRFRCLSPPANFLNSLGGSAGRKRETNGSTRTSEIFVADRRTSQPPMPASAATSSTIEANSDTSAQVNHQAPLNKSMPDGHKEDNQIETLDQVEERETGITSDSGSGVLTDVVTAKPGFLTSAHATNSSSSKQKKLSWIKRLSLTMSNGSYLSGDDTSNGGTISSSNSHKVATSLSTDPSGNSSAVNQGAAPTVDVDSGATTSPKQEALKKDKPKRKSLFSGGLTLGRSSNKQNRISGKTVSAATGAATSSQQ